MQTLRFPTRSLPSFLHLNTVPASALWASLWHSSNSLKETSCHPRHPWATEILFVLEGSSLVVFVSTNTKLLATTVNAGDVFVLPRGLLHFELNVYKGQAKAIAALNSQNPGVQAQAAALIVSGITDVVLEKAFGLSENEVEHIKSKFAA